MAHINDTATSPTARPKIPRKSVVAAVTGNFLEFFDFTSYALFAVMIGKAFFPAHRRRES